MTAQSAADLRPLSIGEIFDRAITLYVRNFVLFSTMMVIVCLPMGVGQYLTQGPGYVARYEQSIETFKHLGALTHAAQPTYTGLQVAGFIAIYITMLLIAPVASNAIAIAIGMLYAGRRPTLPVCFKASLQRWPQLLGTVVLFSLMFGALLLVGGIFLGIVMAIGGAFLAVPVAIALLFVLALMLFAGSFAFFSVAIEGSGGGSAIGLGMRRIFCRDEYRRAILVSLAYAAIWIGVAFVLAAIAHVCIIMLKLPALDVVIVTLANVPIFGFLTALFIVYYFDVRVRQEGFDLESDIARLNADGASAAA